VTHTATSTGPILSPSSPGDCPFCGGAGTHVFDAIDRNRETTDERFPYARCQVCGTVFLVDPPSDLARYYEGAYYQFDANDEPVWKSNAALIRSAAYRVGLLEEHVSPGHLIEIGAGTGAFACSAAAAGFRVSAIEMSERCCRYLGEQPGIEAICSDLPLDALAALPPARAIAMWHVLEHLQDPAEVLRQAAEKLEAGGVLALGVPNARSLQFRLMGPRWTHLDAPRHLCLTPADALLRCAEQLGLRCVAMTTTDPDGLECNQLGWAAALRRRPADGRASWLVEHSALALSAALAPLERTGHRGTAITVLFHKEPSTPRSRAGEHSSPAGA
jgi:2-polyprenyl-3-methyl-5-hydroxy-6-metoxy-1,4-benzoquinol methylase